MTIEMLDVVDENDQVIGTASRKEIHEKGLLHREINVLFITSEGDIIFQRRSKTKDTYPNMLDASVGGHVEIGDSYNETAIKEVKEEAGLDIATNDLTLLAVTRLDAFDTITNMHNNCFRAVYGYVYKGDVQNLMIEDGEGQGFETYPAKDIFTFPDNIKAQFVDRWVDPKQSQDFYSKLLQMI